MEQLKQRLDDNVSGGAVEQLLGKYVNMNEVPYFGPNEICVFLGIALGLLGGVTFDAIA